VTSRRRPRLPQTAVKALHRRSFFILDRTEPAYPHRWIRAKTEAGSDTEDSDFIA